MLHDPGKLAVPAEILTKQGPLNSDEWAEVHRHPSVGSDLLRTISPGLDPVAAAVRAHHERWDGRGYPDGLAGANIPLAGRIVAVADVYDALTHPRSYRPNAYTLTAAVEYLTTNAGSHFAPDVIEAFGRMPELRPHDQVGIERKRIAAEFLDEVRRIDRALVELHGRIDDAVKAARTSVTDVFGVGPIVACYLIGYSGDVHRFPSAGHYARYNATAPIEASTGPKKRHRLNPNGNRQLNHAIHIAALGQISHDTPGRAYYLAKQTEGKSRKEAMRCLKRRISVAVHRQLRADTTT